MNTHFTRTELLISVIAQLLMGCRHVAVGASSPIPGSAALLARKLCGGELRVSVLGSRKNNFFTSGGVEGNVVVGRLGMLVRRGCCRREHWALLWPTLICCSTTYAIHRYGSSPS